MRIYAIVVTYNPEKDLLLKQNTSLISQVDGIVYVDNNSNSTVFMKSLQGNENCFVHNDKNLGLAKAQNQGIGEARKKGADFVILFDQDSVPPVGFVDGLLKCYNENKRSNKIALVGPAIRNLVTGSKVDNKGVVFSGLSIKRVKVDKATEVSYCIASGSLIPIPVLDDVGVMEEKLFIDGLDLEWCLRAKNKGYKIYQTNNTYLDHCLGDGSKDRIMSHSPIREYYIMRNSVWMIKQNYFPIGYRLRRLFLPCGRLIQSLVGMKGSYIKADIKGIIDGIKL